ncbi:MAG TPA: VanZ family protein [Casimicrobium sp.]|jgi:VanZ family protein|nr:VanZ family protein [Casimicrobium sp.]
MKSVPTTSRSLVALWIVGVCVGVIVYASLQPFTGWSTPPANTRFFLWQFAFRWTAADTAFNVVAYVPLGLALVIALPSHWARRHYLVVTLSFALALSLAVETAQMWLPTRYASVYDTLANLAGTLLGALLGLVAVASKRLVALVGRLRVAAIVPGPSGDLQLVLLAVWLLAQVNPAIPLFGAAFHPGSQAAYEPAVVLVELAQTASALIGIGLFTDLTMRKRWMGGMALVLVLLLATVMKIGAAQAVLKPLAWDEWLRPGHTLGLACGAFALMILFWLPRRAKSVLAGIALLSSVLVMLLLPDLVATKAPLSIFSWNYGHLLHLNGMTRTIVMFWPFVATALLLWRFVAPSGGEAAFDNTVVGNA